MKRPWVSSFAPRPPRRAVCSAPFPCPCMPRPSASPSVSSRCSRCEGPVEWPMTSSGRGRVWGRTGAPFTRWAAAADAAATARDDDDDDARDSAGRRARAATGTACGRAEEGGGAARPVQRDDRRADSSRRPPRQGQGSCVAYSVPARRLTDGGRALEGGGPREQMAVQAQSSGVDNLVAVAIVEKDKNADVLLVSRQAQVGGGLRRCAADGLPPLGSPGLPPRVDVVVPAAGRRPRGRGDPQGRPEGRGRPERVCVLPAQGSVGLRPHAHRQLCGPARRTLRLRARDARWSGRPTHAAAPSTQRQLYSRSRPSRWRCRPRCSTRKSSRTSAAG